MKSSNKDVEESASQIIAHWRSIQAPARNTESRKMADIFSEVYEKNIWRGNKEEPFSGGCKLNEKYTLKYIEIVKNFIEENKVKQVIDLGCGNFEVAKQFLKSGIQYLGIDVVPGLIKYLEENYSGSTIGFQCLDITQDELPDSELCLIKEVVQHFSNNQIIDVLEKCKKYKYTIITDAMPHPVKYPNPIENLDILPGPLIRYHFNSVLSLNKPPFNLPKVELLAETEFAQEIIFRTFLLRAYS